MSNVAFVLSRLMEAGYTPAQAQGLVGNLMAESGRGLNTGARNPGDGRDGSDSIGIAQWNSARARALQQFAAQTGRQWTDIGAQADFLIRELGGAERGADSRLRAARTVDEAARAAVSFFRPAGYRPGNPTDAHNLWGRTDFARRLAGMDPSAMPAAPIPSGGGAAPARVAQPMAPAQGAPGPGVPFVDNTAEILAMTQGGGEQGGFGMDFMRATRPRGGAQLVGTGQTMDAPANPMAQQAVNEAGAAFDNLPLAFGLSEQMFPGGTTPGLSHIDRLRFGGFA
jgi:hypothetical protein